MHNSNKYQLLFLLDLYILKGLSQISPHWLFCHHSVRLFPCYGGGNPGPERMRCFCRVTQHASGRDRLPVEFSDRNQVQASWSLPWAVEGFG